MHQTILLSLLLSITTPGVSQAEQPKHLPAPPTGLTGKIQVASEYGPVFFGMRLGMQLDVVEVKLMQEGFKSLGKIVSTGHKIEIKEEGPPFETSDEEVWEQHVKSTNRMNKIFQKMTPADPWISIKGNAYQTDKMRFYSMLQKNKCWPSSVAVYSEKDTIVGLAYHVGEVVEVCKKYSESLMVELEKYEYQKPAVDTKSDGSLKEEKYFIEISGKKMRFTMKFIQVEERDEQEFVFIVESKSLANLEF